MSLVAAESVRELFMGVIVMLVAGLIKEDLFRRFMGEGAFCPARIGNWV